MYLRFKYHLEDGRVGIVKDDKGIARKCYKDSMRLKKRNYADEPLKDDQLKVKSININLREEIPKNQLINSGSSRRMHNNVHSVHPTQNGASRILKDGDRNIGFRLNIRHPPSCMTS